MSVMKMYFLSIGKQDFERGIGVMAKKSIKKNAGTLRGTNAADIISVYGSKNKVYGLGGKDKISVYKGDRHEIFGGSGNDIITISKKSGDHIEVEAGKGNDHITVSVGNYHDLEGGAGVDIIEVTGGKGIEIDGGAGNDEITVKKGTRFEIDGGSGNDIIRITGGKSHEIDGDTGNDRIYINSGKSLDVEAGSGKDKLYIKGGSGHIDLEDGTQKNSVTFTWSGSIGRFTVDTAVKSTKDVLTIKNADSTDFLFKKSGRNGLIIDCKNTAGNILINDWNSHKTFSGITFADTTLSFRQINKKAGF